MKRRIITIIIMLLVSFVLIGCAAGPMRPSEPSTPDIVLIAEISLGKNKPYKEIKDYDIISQLLIQLKDYDSQVLLYKEISNDEYNNIINNNDENDTVYITIKQPKVYNIYFEVYKDGTIIKFTNGIRFVCLALTDYEFVSGVYYFNESTKNTLKYDKVNVINFYEKFSASFDNSLYSIENCFRIYSKDLMYYDVYQVFKFADNCASFLMYNDVVYEIGPWFGGLGVVDVKIDDINDDGFDEIYFTYSWGTGTHFNGLSYFDTKDNKIYELYTEKKNYQELMLINSPSGLIVSRAYFSSNANNFYAYVDLILTYKSELGVINYQDGIVFNVYNS